MRHLSLAAIAAALAGAGLLAACGGSSGGSDSAPPPTSTTGTITLTGVVATGAALPGAAVAAKCAVGTGTATTNANGSYTLTVTAGALPCVLGATSGDGTLVLHSAATGAAGAATATANITTLTELLIARLTGQNPTTYMNGVAAGTLGTTVTAGTLSTAQAAVLQTLAAAGVDTSALGNLVTGTLVAANGGNAGNGYDQVLDALADALATGGSTLTELTATVATSSPASTTTVAQSSSLPADLLLKPKASNCAALRSTDYRILKIAPSVTTGSTDPYTATETMSFDAATLTATFANDTMEWANGSRACHFTSGTAEMVVSPAGVLVVRTLVGVDDDTTSDGGKIRMLIGLPVQDIAVADLAATWSVVNWDLLDGVYKPSAGVITIAANGTSSASKCFENPLNTSEAACTTEPLPPTFSANANGGFTLTSTDSTDFWTSRAFAYRGGSGDLMLVLMDAGGNLGLATRYRTLTPPTVGTVTGSWNIAIDGGLVATDALSTTTNTITAVNGNNVSRNSQTNANAFTTPQQLVYNSPRNGLWYRTPQTGVTNSDGTTSNVRESFYLRLGGMGITAYLQPSTVAAPNNNARFGLSVNQ